MVKFKLNTIYEVSVTDPIHIYYFQKILNLRNPTHEKDFNTSNFFWSNYNEAIRQSYADNGSIFLTLFITTKTRVKSHANNETTNY